MPVKQMRHARFLRRRRARRENAQVAIDLHGIGIDDRAAERLGQGKRQRRLAARGRACDKHRPLCCPIGHCMTCVATLISNPAAPSLDAAAIDRARGALPSAQAPIWLDPGVAADIPFTGDGANTQAKDQRAPADRVRAALAGAPIDVVLQGAAGRRKQLFLADMDSTMIGQECIDELADFVGVKARVAEITERAMRGEIEFEPALRERVALLKDMPVSVVDEVLKKRIKPTPGGRELVATMRANGAYTCLISGGFTLFTSAVAAIIGRSEEH